MAARKTKAKGTKERAAVSRPPAPKRAAP
ncbi:MAG: Heat shock protein, partial [Limisphaerales bacterium]